MVVHVSELKLVLKIRDGSQPPDDGLRPHPSGVVYEQSVERVNAHVAYVSKGLTRKSDAVFHGEHRLFPCLLAADVDRDDQLIEEFGRACSDIDVPISNRIERPRI